MVPKMVLHSGVPLMLFGLARPVVAQVLEKNNGGALLFYGCKQTVGFGIVSSDSNAIYIETVQAETVGFAWTWQIKLVQIDVRFLSG